jgi:hypothetical protein
VGLRLNKSNNKSRASPGLVGQARVAPRLSKEQESLTDVNTGTGAGRRMPETPQVLSGPTLDAFVICSSVPVTSASPDMGAARLVSCSLAIVLSSRIGNGEIVGCMIVLYH